ncbi:MAG: hypothetical protein ACLFRR_09980 [Spirochaetaceae bacterium]
MGALFVIDLTEMVRSDRDIVAPDITWNGTELYARFMHDGIRFAMYERRMLSQLLGRTPSYPDGKLIEIALHFRDQEID